VLCVGLTLSFVISGFVGLVLFVFLFVLCVIYDLWFLGKFAIEWMNEWMHCTALVVECFLFFLASLLSRQTLLVHNTSSLWSRFVVFRLFSLFRFWWFFGGEGITRSEFSSRLDLTWLDGNWERGAFVTFRNSLLFVVGYLIVWELFMWLVVRDVQDPNTFSPSCTKPGYGRL